VSQLWNTVIPTWASAIGTIGAFATGFVLLTRELVRERQRELQARREKAALFAVWPARALTQHDGISAIEAHLAMNNAGPEPVYDVTVQFSVGAEQEIVDYVGVVPPGLHRRDLPRQRQEVWIKSGASWLLRGSHSTPAVEDPLRADWLNILLNIFISKLVKI